MMPNPIQPIAKIDQSPRMSEAQEQHLYRVLAQVRHDIDKKYRRGQREHGGNLWDKAGLIDMAIEEAIDQLVYLYTLREQIEEGNRTL